MDVGIPRESRPGEHRVPLTPWGVKALVQRGHRVWVETGAGAAAGYPDSDYQSAGASIGFSRSEAFARGTLVGAVSAPEPRAYELLQKGQVVFAFWALPAVRPEDVRALLVARLKPVEPVMLVPYGRTKFRISMFPVTAGPEVKHSAIRRIMLPSL